MAIRVNQVLFVYIRTSAAAVASSDSKFITGDHSEPMAYQQVAFLSIRSSFTH